MMSEKGFNLFDERAAECVHLHPQEEYCLFFLWEEMYPPGTIVNSQRIPTKINKNGAIVKVRISVEQVVL